MNELLLHQLRLLARSTRNAIASARKHWIAGNRDRSLRDLRHAEIMVQAIADALREDVQDKEESDDEQAAAQ